MSVHYKFKTCLNYDKVTFDGVHISVADLKKAIMQQKKIGKSADFDLQITNQQTKEVYSSDEDLVPKNTTVIVARVPVSGSKKNWEKNEVNTVSNNNTPAHVALEKIIKSLDLSNSDASEEEKIKQVMSQSTQDYDSSKFVKSRGFVGPLPPNYTCYRCGQSGHYIKHCPTNNMEIKRSTGIPRSFMIPATADQKGALLTASGEYAVPIIDHEAYKEVKKEKPPFAPGNDQEIAQEEQEIPQDLQCMLCRNLLQDAVLIACCGNSYCDECIRANLLDSEQHECPTCHETGISPDTLIPNRFLRNAVNKFKNETGYIKPKSENDVESSVSQSQNEVKTNEVKSNEVSQKFPVLELKSVTEETHDSVVNNVPTDSATPVKTESELTINSSDERITSANADEVKTEAINSEETEKSQTNNEGKEEDADITEKNEHEKSLDSEELSDAKVDEGKPITVNDYSDVVGNESPSFYGDNRYTNQCINNRNVIRPVTSLVPGGMQYNRGPILPLPPRGLFPRPGMPPDARFYRAPMRDPHGYSMPLGPMGYGYGAPHMRPPNYHDPYGYMAHRPPHAQYPRPGHLGNHHQGYTDPPPPGSSPHNMMGDNNYGSYATINSNDYEDPLDKFAKQLQSKSRRKRNSRSKTRSRSPVRSRSRTRRSRSHSSRSSSSKSRSFSFSSSSKSSYSASSRSRSRSPYGHHSMSRTNRKKYSRSKSPSRHRHGYNYRSKKSPAHGYLSSRHIAKPSRRSVEEDRHESRPKHKTYSATQVNYFENVKSESDRSRKLPVKDKSKRSSHHHSGDEKKHSKVSGSNKTKSQKDHKHDHKSKSDSHKSNSEPVPVKSEEEETRKRDEDSNKDIVDDSGKDVNSSDKRKPADSGSLKKRKPETDSKPAKEVVTSEDGNRSSDKKKKRRTDEQSGGKDDVESSSKREKSDLGSSDRKQRERKDEKVSKEKSSTSGDHSKSSRKKKRRDDEHSSRDESHSSKRGKTESGSAKRDKRDSDADERTSGSHDHSKSGKRKKHKRKRDEKS